LIYTTILFLLVSYVLSNYLLISTHCRYEISPGPEMLTYIVPFPSSIHPGYMDRTLAFDKSYDLRYRIFWWNRYHYVDVVGHQMTFLY